MRPFRRVWCITANPEPDTHRRKEMWRPRQETAVCTPAGRGLEWTTASEGTLPADTWSWVFWPPGIHFPSWGHPVCSSLFRLSQETTAAPKGAGIRGKAASPRPSLSNVQKGQWCWASLGTKEVEPGGSRGGNSSPRGVEGAQRGVRSRGGRAHHGLPGHQHPWPFQGSKGLLSESSLLTWSWWFYKCNRVCPATYTKKGVMSGDILCGPWFSDSAVPYVH